MDPNAFEKLIGSMNEQLAAAGEPPFRFKTVEQGAATSVWAGVTARADDVGGRYCENCHVSEVAPPDQAINAVRGGVRAYALDPENARALWAKSEEMTGEHFE